MVRKVVRVDHAPLNALRWVLVLECGHEVWVTAAGRPSRRQSECRACDSKAGQK